MNSKIKNIIIGFIVLAVLGAGIYFFLIKKDSAPTLTSSTGTVLPTDSTVVTTDETAQISKDFLSLLLSVKSIKLDDAILKNQTFSSLKDSSIVLTQDGNEGRTNPFAPIGYESMAVTPTIAPVVTTNTTTTTTTTTNPDTEAKTVNSSASKKN